MAVSSAAILHRQGEHESAARSHARHLPIVPVRAEGMTIHAADRHAFLGCLSGAGVLALGHNRLVARTAVRA